MTLQILRHVVVLLFVCNTMAYYEFDENSLNVGTVLFSSSDVVKNRWSKKEIGLLRARRYFQKLIPPPHFLQTADERYIDDLLQYFKNTYTSIKRDATDPEADQIMTIALSDAIGGYLKEWVLPITKYAYYGGTVSQDNVVKIFKFYDEIKHYLDTDGQGWRQPNLDLLTSTSIKVAPPKKIERNKQNPCEKLAYFEQTPSGLSVPLPYVNWNGKSSTMFVPLKNQSLIALDSPNSKVNPLIRYYDVAKQCTESISANDENDFDEKFQVWLCKDIIPHLNDDQVYLGLGNVLTLVDQFNKKCDLSDHVEAKPHCCDLKRISKKMLFIITILFIEAAWCIPALVILFRKKMKKCASDDSKTSEEDNTKQSMDAGSQWTDSAEKARTGIKISKKQHLRNVALETKLSMFVSKQSIGTGSQIQYSSKICSTSVLNIVDETPSLDEKASVKKLKSQSQINKNPSQTKCICSGHGVCSSCQKCASICCSKSIGSIQSKQKTTVPQESKKLKKQMDDNEGIKETENIEKEVKKCPCLPCVKTNPIKQASAPKHEKAKPTEVKYKATRLRIQREINCKGKHKSGNPYVEVTIDRPQKEITVGFGKGLQKELPNPARPSRIPKLTYKSVCGPPSPRKSPKLSFLKNRKSLIPQLTKQTTDDIAIKNVKAPKDDKLNVTL